MEQLIYGSADNIAGRVVGGWGVLHSTADLTAETEQQLLPLVSVSMPTTMPQFPSAKELAQRQPRFRSKHSPDGLLLCRSVEAGRDHTGRPGNVVSHGARTPLRAELRPADWFFSSGWLAPFGPQQMAQAALPESLESPQGWAATAEWLRQDPQRVVRLRWLVDVALALFIAGENVILKAPSVEEQAHWASAISWTLDANLGQMPALFLGVDHTAPLDQITSPSIVGVLSQAVPEQLAAVSMLDTGWNLDVSLAETGGSWQLPDGQVFPATADSVITDLVYAAPEVAQAVFTARDKLASSLAAAQIGSTLPLQMTMLQAAWLMTPGAQLLARRDLIQRLLDRMAPTLAQRPEFSSLVAEVAPPMPASPAAATITDDIYAFSATAEDVWEGIDDDPAAVNSESSPETGREAALARYSLLKEALICAATLAQNGVGIIDMIESGTVREEALRHTDDEQVALHLIADVLELHQEGNA